MSLLHPASPASSDWESTTDTPPSTPSEHGLEKDDRAFDFAARSAQARFSFWRPSYHLQPPDGGWMNDPCGPGYDPTTKLYHVSFQHNPHGNDWGNMSWLSATSPDMVNWTVNPTPALSPDQPYDHEGVFTGCLTQGTDGSLHYFYTSVTDLPIHWTLPHPEGSEGLSMATSLDGGRTWAKSTSNPIIRSEPAGINVTGWRDPYVGTWPSMSRVLGLRNEMNLFGIISGGIRDAGPASFLYSIKPEDPTTWEFINPITITAADDKTSKWCGQLGRNWECTNFISLKADEDEEIEQDFLMLGAEGCEVADDAATDEYTTWPQTPARNQLWAAVSPLKNSSDDISVSSSHAGYLDHGCLYAANSFFDPVSSRHVFYGWIPEDDLSDELRHAQGWSGMLSLPRELRIQTLENVIGTCASELTEIKSAKLEACENGSYTVRTLTTQPCSRVVEALRKGSGVRHRSLGRSMLRDVFTSPSWNSANTASLDSTQWELNCSFGISSACTNVGLRIRHSATQTTTLEFVPKSETFKIHRPSFPCSRSERLINTRPEYAAHTLFNVLDPKTGGTNMETLDIRVWRDNSVLEVFVNGRTAISTRLYTLEDGSGELEFFAEDTGAGTTELLHAHVWDGLGRASP